MNLPIPPTDNLYKFAALAGAIGIACSFYFPGKLLLDIHSKKAALLLSLAELEVELDFLDKELNDLEEDVEHAKTLQEEAEASGNTLEELAHEVERFQRVLKVLRSQQKVIHLKRARQLSEQSILVDLKRQSQAVMWIAVGGLICSFAISGWGFRNWYLRIQLVHDRLLHKDLLSVTKQLTDGQTPPSQRTSGSSPVLQGDAHNDEQQA